MRALLVTCRNGPLNVLPVPAEARLSPTMADMVPLVPESLLIHEKVTGASPSSSVPLPIPIDVHAGRLTTMSRQQCAAGHAMNRLECLLDDTNSLHSVFSAQRCAPSVEVMRCSVCAPANSPSSKLNFR